MPTVEVTRTMPTSASALFAFWHDQAALSACLGLTRSEMDFREGGRWFWDWTPEANDPDPCGGEYLAIEPDKRLVLTWSGSASNNQPTGVTTVTITFKAFAEKETEMTLAHELNDPAHLDDYTRGWNGSFEAIHAHLSAAKV